jgi:hypothetical protein
MTKKSPETLIAICDVVASGILSYAAACRSVGVSARSFWSWIKASQSGDEEFIVEYLGERIQFARAVNAARRMALHEMRGRMEQKSIFGYDEPIFYMGMPTWKPDPRCVGIDDPDIREMLGYPRDGLLRDESGAVVQNVIHHEPPVALQLRVAEMAFPNEYRPGTNSTVAISGSAVVGVAMMKPMTGPPKIPPAPPLPQLEVMDAPDQLAIPETDEPSEEIADEETAEDQDRVAAPVRADPMIIEEAPANYQPPTPDPLLASCKSVSPLVADLLARARAPIGSPERTKPII